MIPALWEAEADVSLEPKSPRPASATWRDPTSTKSFTISQSWQHTPVVPAAWESEEGGSLEPKEAEGIGSHDHASALQSG